MQKRDIGTPEVREALDLLEPHIHPAWLVPQYRHALDGHGDRGYVARVNNRVLRPTFEGIRDSVRELVGNKMDALARQFHQTHDMKVKDEIERLAGEYSKLGEPWIFVAK